MSFIKKISRYGVSSALTTAEKRNIILTNYISLIAACATILLLIGRYFFAYVNASVALTLLQGALLFLIPVVLNRFDFTKASRIVLCWIPALYQLYSAVQALEEGSANEATAYVGLRFFIIAFSCFPFLVFSLEDKLLLFFVGLLGPLLTILSFDFVLNFFGVGYTQSGFNDPSYDFNIVRSFISFTIIGASCYLLKNFVEGSERLNERLIKELDQKNRIIQEQAQDEVHRVNQKLHANLQQLRQSEIILNQSQRIAKVGSWEYRTADKSVFWSDELYNIFGVDRNFDLNAPGLAKTLWGNQSDILISSNRDLLRTGKSYDLTLTTKTPLGYSKWIRIYAYPVYQGNIISGATGICHDITIYKESEERITRNEQKYRSLFEQASEAIFLVDFEGNFTEVNPALEKMFGYTREELLRLNISALMETNALKDKPLQFDSLKAGNHIFNERTMIRKDGAIVEAEANVKMSGENQIMAIVRDVTELREVQRQVQLSEARFRGAFEYSAIGMALVSIEGRWLKVNKELCHITGYSEEELLTMNFQQITHPDDLARDMEIIQKVGSGERERYEVEKRYFHKGGNLVWVNLNVTAVKDNESKSVYFVAQVENITERKTREQELVVANKKIGELKLMALRSVMNPHFVFNVLNSIQFYITTNDRLNAINYLSKFSKLIRSILSHSVDNKIKLADEIEMLKNYIQLEMTRFENKFDFVLDVDSQIELDGIEIPSLLIQPYVENAILHGLYNKHGAGTLKISINENEDAIVFQIEDDGIGREAARQLRQQNFPTHKSMGIKLTEERLKLINEHHNVAFEVKDLETDNSPAGTRVKIWIKI